MPQPITLHLPLLSPEDAKALNDALADAQAGANVEIAVTYTKVTSTPARVPGEDFRPLLGTTEGTLIGVVKKVSIGRNGPYVLIDATITRAPLGEDKKVDPEKIGWTTIKGKGVSACQVLKNSAADERRKKATQ